MHAVVIYVTTHWHGVTANTYVDHPWPGWDAQSIDFWGPAGRGDPIRLENGKELLLMSHSVSPAGVLNWLPVDTDNIDFAAAVGEGIEKYER